LETHTFRWTRKTGATMLGLGLVLLLVSLFMIDVCTVDVLGNNPTDRFGDMRLAWPAGGVLQIAGTILHDLLTLLILFGAACSLYLGLCLTAISAASLLSPKVAITLDERGVRNWFWSDTLVPWSEVKRIDGIRWQPDGELSAGSYVTLIVDDPAKYLDRARPIWRRRTPFFIKQLSVAYIFLDNPVGFVGALLGHRPDPEKPPQFGASPRP
jgi:hypothetical protein